MHAVGERAQSFTSQPASEPARRSPPGRDPTGSSEDAFSCSMLLDSLDGIGWVSRPAEDPEVAELRQQLQQRAGIESLRPIDPAEPAYAEAAAAQFREHGFCVVLKVLDEQRLTTIREGCAKVVKGVVASDPQRAGNRGSHRYGFDGAVAHFDALSHWACIIDPPVLNECLTAILGEGYIADSEYFGGGDFTLVSSSMRAVRAACCPLLFKGLTRV